MTKQEIARVLVGSELFDAVAEVNRWLEAESERALTAEERLEQMTRERDEARAQLAAISSLHGALAAINAMARERDEARAEVATAYRRGAEAMREACVDWARDVRSDPGSIASDIEDMPIPEEP